VADRASEGRLMARQRPTRRQLEVLRAYIRAGSVAAAAHELGIGETTVRQHLSGLYRRTGCLNAAQAAYWLGTKDFGSDATPNRVGTAEGQPMVRSIRPDAIRP
jgi:DNA-binding NarL/FixJ family response regulator